MNARLNILLALAVTCALACKGANDGDESQGARDAVETNVLRGSCDAGACDAGELLAAEPSEELPCDDDDDCPDNQRCNTRKICAPKMASESH